MTWTYNGDPTESDVSRVRFLIGDTTQTAFSLSDGEILFTLSDSKSGDGTMRYREAAALACEAVATRYAKEATKSKRVGDLIVVSDYTTAADSFLKLADRLRTQMGGSATFSFDLQAPDPSDGDDRDPQFTLGMHDDLNSNTPDQPFANFPEF